MAKYCTMCGSPLPPNQGSNTCSMCYGEVDHGSDGYYRQYLESSNELEQQCREQESEEQQ